MLKNTKINNCANVFRNICKIRKRNAKSVKLTESHVMTLCFHWNISTVYLFLSCFHKRSEVAQMRTDDKSESKIEIKIKN